jgi:hypothetical protein
MGDYDAGFSLVVCSGWYEGVSLRGFLVRDTLIFLRKEENRREDHELAEISKIPRKTWQRKSSSRCSIVVCIVALPIVVREGWCRGWCFEHQCRWRQNFHGES